ncbi:transposase [Sporomusa sphaeroides]|uniref:transposase n=1 Tax=Sporomusa sphaeroides TaxID=47679 RepID=UPI002C3D4F47|nr:transposase [Sporomusa sphaeroides]HML34180.1 transposase [Sporomusa sphaeroides]
MSRLYDLKQDGATHQPVAILEGRDGKTLKEWLRNNKHVKVVTRDRASAYAAAIQEILPDAMQIVDRFHLHQNLLEVVRNTVNLVLPVDLRIPKEPEQIKYIDGDGGQHKKNNDVNNFIKYDENCVQRYHVIKEQC